MPLGTGPQSKTSEVDLIPDDPSACIRLSLTVLLSKLIYKPAFFLVFDGHTQSNICLEDFPSFLGQFPFTIHF